jgi:alpha-L-fucosidase 2
VVQDILEFAWVNSINTGQKRKEHPWIWHSTRRRFIFALSSMLASLRVLRYRAFSSTRRTQDDLATLQEYKRANTQAIWFEDPAKQWADALPVGNGRLGAMVFGGRSSEHLALNEDTLWSSMPRDWNNPRAKEHLSIVRKYVFEEKDYHPADAECCKMQGPYNQAFEPLGDLAIKFKHSEDVTSYRRLLDLDSAVASVSYRVGDCRYTREVFASTPDQVIVVRLFASTPVALNCELRLTSQLQSKSQATADGEIRLTGKAPTESIPSYLRDAPNPIQYDAAPGKGMFFSSLLRVRADDGNVSALPDGGLRLQGATSAVLLIGTATGVAAVTWRRTRPWRKFSHPPPNQSRPRKTNRMRNFSPRISKTTESCFAVWRSTLAKIVPQQQPRRPRPHRPTSESTVSPTIRTPA